MPKQFLKFLVVGSINTAIDFAVYFTLTRYVDFFLDKPVRAKILGFIAAAAFSYFANRYWTFAKKGAFSYSEAAKFYLTASGGLVINASALYLLVHGFGLYDLLAFLGATATTVIWNFFVSKYWVFSDFSTRAYLKRFIAKK